MRKRRAKANVKASHSQPPKKFVGRYGQQEDRGSNEIAYSDDVDSDYFYHDEIDDFHKDQEKILLQDDRRSFRENFASKEEEVMPLTDDDEEEEDDDDDVEEEEDEIDDDEDQQSIHKSDMGSDLEDKSDDDLPNLDAWGKKKSTYYHADFVDMDWGKSYREETEEEAKAEEMAAMEIQNNVYANMLTEDAFLGSFMTFQKEPVNEKEMEKAVIDWSTVSYEDKLKRMKKVSPEFFLLVDDFKKLMKELIERIEPIYELVKAGRIKANGAADYIRLKRGLILDYCMNISFYMMLKSGGKPVKYHPVMKTLSEFKEILNDFQYQDERLKPEMDYILEKLKRGEEIEFMTPSEAKADKETPVNEDASVMVPKFIKRILEEQAKFAHKPKKQKVGETETEKEVQSLYMDMKKNQRDAKRVSGINMEDEFQEDEEDYNDEYNELEEFENDETVDEKRAITYEIAKNKGLVPYRKKEYRNPRVRNRMKYRRAKIRRKGQVREPRKEVTRYGGELSGIRTDVTRSIKLK